MGTTTELKPVNGLEEIARFVFTTKYARYNEKNKRRETWNETIGRVESMHLQKFKHLSAEDKKLISDAFDFVRAKKVVPSMRSMQFGGKAVFAHNARLFNCAVRHVDSVRSFSEIFYLLLCGCGVGIGLSKTFLDRLPDLVTAADKTGTVVTYTVQDTIEGWADSVEVLLNCYTRNNALSGRKIVFDYSKIRPEGAKIKTGGGKAPGYRGLKSAHKKIKDFLDHLIEKQERSRLRSVDAYDILMHCSDAVLSGGIRRSATSVIFMKEDEDMLNAKTNFAITKHSKFHKEDNGQYSGKVVVNKKEYEVTVSEWEYQNTITKDMMIGWHHIEPQRARSNNSIMLLRNQTTLEDFRKVIDRTRQYGEPGFVFADHPQQLLNPCFDRNTRIATDRGLFKIGDLYNQGETINTVVDNRIGKGDIYNGEYQGTSIKSATKVELTQKNADIYKLVTEHGHELSVTANHEFITPSGRKKLCELELGDTILIQSGEGIFGTTGSYSSGLMLGMVTGDGTFTDSIARISIWEPDFENKDDIIKHLHKTVGSIGKVTHKRDEEWVENNLNYSNVSSLSVNSSRLYKHFMSLGINDPKTIKDRVPECVWQGSRDMIKGYLQGLIFADGSVNLKCANKGSVSTLNIEIAQSNEELLKDVQILLNNFGIVSRLYKLHDDRDWLLPDGNGGEKVYACKAGYRLSINRPNAIKLLNTIGLYGRKHEILQNLLEIRGTSCRKPEKYLTTVKSINFSHKDDVFCFTQKDTNSTIANGLAVGQCFEISFVPVTEDGVCGVQFCNLTSINGAKVKTKQDFIEASRAASLIGTLQAAYTDFKYLSNAAKKLTDDEALLGVSITGMMDNPAVLLDPDCQNLASAAAVETNRVWADKIGIKQAARVTCIKPEGTSSLVLESASGIHPHHARKYFRRVQMNKIDNVYQFFKMYNSHMCEPSVWSANKTDDVVCFPIEVSPEAIVKGDLSAKQHLEYIKSTQTNWVIPGTNDYEKPIHHNVSCTVSVKDDEWDFVTKYLFDNRQYFCAVSLLPDFGDKLYAQAPNESVSTETDKQKYEAIIKNMSSVDYTKLQENEDETSVQATVACAGNACEFVFNS